MTTRVQNYWTYISSVILIAAAGWLWISRTDPSSSPLNRLPAPQEGFPAPGFTLHTLDGREISLSDFEGSPVLINIWASWCGPCRAEMPDIQDVYNDYRDEGFVVLAINATNQDNINDVKEFVNDHGLTFPILLDKSGQVSNTYNLRSLPTSFFINEDGVIHKIIIGGPMRAPTIEKNLKQMMARDR